MMKLLYAVSAVLLLTVLATVFLAFTTVPWWLTQIDLRHVTSSGGIPISVEKQLEAVEVVRDRLLNIAAGIGALGTLVFTGLTFLETRKLNVVTRYSSATEKLGAATPADRVGGIYALEQLARDHPPYHMQVVDVLAAFVRARTREGQPPAAPSSSEGQGKVRPASDVQAALTVLGRRPEKLVPKEYDKLRFSDCTLTGANLRKANMADVRLRRAVLKKVRFEKAHLERSKLRKAHLQRAHLEGAHLEGAYLEGAHLEGAYLEGAHLDGAHLAGAMGKLELDKTTGKVHCGQEDSCSEAGA